MEHTESISEFWLKMYGSSKAMEGTTFRLQFSLMMGVGEKHVCSYFKMMCFFSNKHCTMDLYPPALGTIPFGYWASRVLGPSSKARDGSGLYT